MGTFWLCFTAFTTSFVFTYISVWNSKRFSNYFFLVRYSTVVLTYCLFYGVLAASLYLLLAPGKLTIEDQLLQLPGEWALAIGVGMVTHGVADLNFFNIRHAGESFPVGLRSFSRYAEAYFERQCDSVCFDRFILFIAPYRNKYRDADLNTFKEQVVQLLSAHPSPEKVAAFTSEVMAPANSAKEIIDGILREFGRDTLQTIDRNMQALPASTIVA
ncbi:hypothetical protein [Terrimonas ferruginea]|uniref:hypothetical protein n=1 Tax=Terrimonas ferruginea TaxID=249 RepID=UPI000416093A|nr:hypothetical protein [Terrimonas ferruginea]